MEKRNSQAELIASSLLPSEMKALNALHRAFYSFTPLSDLPGLREGMAETLLAQGLAEKGRPEGFIGNPDTGYRLTDLGWSVREVRLARRSTR